MANLASNQASEFPPEALCLHLTHVGSRGKGDQILELE
jgi:hypothetical protein